MKRQYLHTAILLLLIWCGTATKAGAANFTVDLSAVSNTGGDGYSIDTDGSTILLNQAGGSYLLKQSGTSPTSRGIKVTKSCDIKLNGVNIAMSNGDVFFVESGNTVNLTFEGDNTLRTESRSTALANLGTLTLSAVTGEADVLRCIAPQGNGINLKGNFTLVSGTVYAEGGGDYNGMQMNYNGNVEVNFTGGTVVAKGVYGINAGNAAFVTFGGGFNLTAYGINKGINAIRVGDPLLTNTLRWSYISAPSTTDETVLVVKNSSGQDVRTFTLPAGYKGFAANLPAGETYTLWLREGATDTQLQAADGTTAFAVGGEYTGMTAAGGTDPGTTDIEIDLSTVATSGDGYTVTSDKITLSGADKTYIFTQSEATATIRAIRVEASCTVKLNGVNIAVSGADGLYVQSGCTVNLTFEGDNTLNVTTENSAIYNKGSLTLSAVNGEANILRCIAPEGNGINSAGSFTLNSGTVYAEGGGGYFGMLLTNLSTGSVLNFSGGTLFAKGAFGINGSGTVPATIGDGFILTAYGRSKSINAPSGNTDPLLTRTVRWSYASAPSTTDETVLVVKNSTGQVVRTLNLPASYTKFGCTLPAGDYTLWLREGTTDTQLQDATGTTAFTVGSEYTGLTAVVGTTEVEIDLSTVTTDGDGYTVASDQITLSGAGKSYVFTQSGATPTTRAISIEASCTVKLSGVNISVTGNDAFKVNESSTVNLAFEGDNTLNVTTAHSAIYNGKTLTLSAVNGNADILRCIAPRGTGINLKGNFTLDSGTVYAEGGEAFNGIEMTFTSNATVNFSGGTVVAKGANGINNGEINTTVTMGEGFSLTAYGSSKGIKAALSTDPLFARTIRWKYDNAPSTTDETVLVVKDSTGKVVRTFNLPAGYKGFACNLPAGNYTLWQRDMTTHTDTQLQDGSGTTAFAVGSGYEGLTLTETSVQLPFVAYTTAAGEQTPIDFSDLTVETAKGLLKDATTLHISGTWDNLKGQALRVAITDNASYSAGNNAVLKTVTFDPNAVMQQMMYLFNNCTALESVTLPTKTNTGIVNFRETFKGCKALKTVDLSKFTAISGMQNTFNGCAALESVTMPAETNTQLVSFNGAFRGCKALKTVDLSKFTAISSMQGAFDGCTALTGVTMPDTNTPPTAGVIFTNAFFGCTSLNTVNLSAFAAISNMQNAFYGCTALTGVTMPAETNTRNVNFQNAFNGCTALQSVDLSRFTAISGMEKAFYGCTALTGVTLPATNAPSVTTVSFNNTFANCPALEGVTLPAMGSSIAVDAGAIFANCTSLKTADLSRFANISYMGTAFSGCTALESVTMPTEPNSAAIGFNYAFSGCTSLKSVDLSAFTAISSMQNTFNGCTSLTSMKLGGTRPAAITGTFGSAPSNCLVYVPAGWGAKPGDWYYIIYIVDGKTVGNINLWADKPFHCPEAFTIGEGNRITYQRNFGTEPSGIGGKAAGWETLCLPFTPTEITGANKRYQKITLVPFNAEGTYEGKGTEGVVPFWLRALTGDKYTPVTTIEPDKPYIIAMPNNPAYDDKFNVVNESVHFSATATADAPITIGVTPDVLPSVTGASYTLHSNYSTVLAAQSMYVINTEGTAFVANGGNARSFRPYVTANNPMGAPARFVIGEDEGGATAIEEAVLMGRDGGNGADGFRVYGGVEPGSLVVEVSAATVSTVDVVAVDGRTVRTVSLHEGVNVVNGLAAGVYVVGGQKAVVR